MTIPCKSPFTVDQYTTYRGLLNVRLKVFVEILGMGEWAPLPPHGIRSTLSGGCLKSLGGVSGFGGAGGGPIVLVFKV